jgi:hypothetical protein
MSALSIEVPFPVFYDRAGEPLENGYVWIGQANLNPQTNPIQVYFDKNLTQPAAQPLRTLAGYIANAGTPAQVYVDAVDFSILVQDKNGTMVYNFPEGTGISPDACGVIYNPPFTNSVPTPVCVKLAETVSVKDFGAVGDGVTNDTTSFVNALASNQNIYIPDGSYLLDSFTISNAKLFGTGTLIWNGPATTNWITLDNNASLSGLTFDGNETAHSFLTDIGGINVNGVNANIEDCDFSNFRKYIIITTPDIATGGTVTNCRFHDSGRVPNSNAITIRSSNWVVIGNHFDGTNWYNEAHMIRVGQFSAITNDVKNVSITGNFFTNPRYTGVVLEFNSKQITITGNTFDNLQQGVKIEREDNTVQRISITGNSFNNLTISTALNLNGDYVIFSGNTVKNMNGTLDIGNYGIVSNNYFENQTDTLRPCIRQQSLFTGAKITGNIIRSCAFDGISVGGLKAEIIGNFVENPGRNGISITPPAGSENSFTVNSNTTVGGVAGINLSSAVKNTICDGNNCSGASTNNYSMTYNDNWKTNMVTQSNINWLGRLNTFVIASGQVTIGQSDNVSIVDTEGGAATDDLTVINGATMVGKKIILRTISAARVVTVKDSTQLRLAGDFVMNSPNDTIELIWTGSQWLEVARSDNA